VGIEIYSLFSNEELATEVSDFISLPFLTTEKKRGNI
jgi:hypothetical protein